MHELLNPVIEPSTRWRLKREAKAYWSYLTSGSAPSKKVLIWAQGRTGSTVFENLLASTGYFSQTGELLSREYDNVKVRYPIAFLKGTSRFAPHENFVCHVKIYQLLEDRKRQGCAPVEPAEFLQSLKEDGWQFVYVRRRDKFQHFLSGELAKARGAYHKFDAQPEDFTIRLERDRIETAIARRNRWDQREQAALENIEYFPVVYEDNLSSVEAQKETIRRVLEFLDLPYREPKTRMKKINSRGPHEIIENYAEVQDWLKELSASPLTSADAE
ncbi:MAG: hypothetical protein AAF251_11610 [Pseudomonadota bacterium]